MPMLSSDAVVSMTVLQSSSTLLTKFQPRDPKPPVSKGASIKVIPPIVSSYTLALPGPTARVRAPLIAWEIARAPGVALRAEEE
jgi:hypothetical protein